MNVLSLFDGMSCGQQALERAGIPIENYYASEIDKYAITVTMANYPNTIQLGSVIGVDGYKLPKIDLLIGGSPCQSFSFAGKRKGMSTKCETEILTLEHYLELKAEGYEFEGQSYLFWEYMRLLNEVKPKYFLLENVEMGEKWEKVLSKAIGVNGIHINSALVSAQNRKRIYWTNIGMIPGGLFGDLESIIQQPKDKGILLKDILESAVDEKYFLSEKMINGFLAHNKRHIEEKNQSGFNWKPTEGNKKGNTLRANPALCPTDNSVIVQDAHNISNQGKMINEKLQKSHSLMARDYKGFGNQGMTGIVVHNTMPRSGDPTKGGTGHLSRSDGKTYCLDTGNTNAVEIVGLTEVRTEEAKQIRKETGTNPKRAKELVERTDGKIGALLTSQTPDNLLKITNAVEMIQLPHGTNKGGIVAKNGKTPSMTISSWQCNNMPIINSRIRRLTPTECERLQTVADNYTNHVSDSQRYKMLGNGWTISVVSHIFSYLPKEYFVSV
jgi:DNA-cytosine methyltransferase